MSLCSFDFTPFVTIDKTKNNLEINKTLRSLKSKDVNYLKAVKRKAKTIPILYKTDYFNRVSEMLKFGVYLPIDKKASVQIYFMHNNNHKKCKNFDNSRVFKELMHHQVEDISTTAYLKFINQGRALHCKLSCPSLNLSKC